MYMCMYVYIYIYIYVRVNVGSSPWLEGSGLWVLRESFNVGVENNVNVKSNSREREL